MPDDKPPTVQPPVQAFEIPPVLIAKWLALPKETPIQVAITRQDLDNLFFSITSGAQATFALQQCLIHYSQGKLDEANQAMSDSQRKNAEGDNHIRMFINAIMAAAVIGGSHG